MTEAISFLAGSGRKWGYSFDPQPLQQFWALQRRELTSALQLSERFIPWRQPFCNIPLRDYHWQSNYRLHAALQLAEKADGWRRNVNPQVFDEIFGTSRSDHAFAAPKIDWGIRLSELQATKTLAKFLEGGANPVRAYRIAAFLKALGVDDVTADELHHSKVIAEQNRIDLQIRWPKPEGGENLVIVEAKLDHKVTIGQLGKYRKKTKQNNGLHADRYILIAIHEHAKRGLKGQQHNIWQFVSWRDLWLKFEKHRPEEADLNLAIFMHTLWHRIRGLNPRRK